MAVGVWCIVKCNTGVYVLRHLGFELGRGLGINEKGVRLRETSLRTPSPSLFYFFGDQHGGATTRSRWRYIREHTENACTAGYGEDGTGFLSHPL